MQTENYPFAVRLVGFAPDDARRLALQLSESAAAGPAFFCLSDDSLQDPDLLIANGDELKALAALAVLTQGDLRPALILGAPAFDLPYPNLAKPADTDSIHAELGQLVLRRADAYAHMAAAGTAPMPERRLRERLDFDLTDPAEYEARRRHGARGAVLVVDRNSVFSQHLAGLLQPYGIPALHVGGETEAVLTCAARAVAVVLINTALAAVDPYRLCAALKDGGGPLQPAVVMLVAPPFVYDAVRGRVAGAEGLLDRPVADHHLRAVLRKLMSIA